MRAKEISIRTKRVVAFAMAAIMCMTGSQMKVFAANDATVSVPNSGSAEQSVTATFTIDEDTLTDLGYGAVVYVPLTVPLAYKSHTKTFEGKKTVYCSGVINEGKQVSVSIDTVNSDYGTVKDEGDNSYQVKNRENFAVSLSKTVWSQKEMLQNFNIISNEGELSHLNTGTSSVTIPGKGFVPKITGDFPTVVPLIIKQESEG